MGHICPGSRELSGPFWENNQYLLYRNPSQIFMATFWLLGGLHSGFLAMIQLVEVAGIMTSQSLFFKKLLLWLLQ